MLRVIIEKEIRDLAGSPKFVLTFSVCALLIILSFFVGAANYKASVERYDAAQAENLRRFDGITDWLDVRDTRVFLPPQPLEALVAGISNDIGRTTDIEARGELAAHGSRYNEEPILAVFRFLDLEFIFLIVLSLFAILLGYDSISGEKERGTLKLVLSNAVPRAKYVLGKFLGSFGVLTVSLLSAIAVGCLTLPVMGVSLVAGDWIRLGLIVLAGLLYFGVFLSASIYVSCLTHRSSSSFMIMLVVWIVSVMIIPRASVLLAGRAVEVPSVDELGAQKAAYNTDLWESFRNDLTSYKGINDVDIDAMMTNFNKFMDSLTTDRDDKMDAFASRLNEQRYNRQIQQQRVALNLARVSPATSLSLATADLAGTSLKLKERYHDETVAYQQAFGEFLHEKTGLNVGGRMIVIRSGDEEDQKEPIQVAEIPVFRPQSSSLEAAIESAAVNMGLLAIFNLIFFAAAFVSFGRYDAR